MSSALDLIEKAQLKKDLPDFKPGDKLRVHARVKEGEKSRVQVFEGTCIMMHRRGISSTMTVRKMSYGVGVERIFPLHSPNVEKIEVLQIGRVRRSRLFYLRELEGKSARIREEKVAVVTTSEP